MLFDFKKVKIRSRKTCARGEKKKKERKISIFRSWRKESENRRGLQKWFCRVCIDWGRGSPRRLAYILAPLFLRPSRPTCASPSPCRSRFPFCTPRPNLQSSFNIPILSPSTPPPPSCPFVPFSLPFNCYSDTDERKREGQTQTVLGREGGGGRVETKESRDVYVCVYVYTSGMEVGEAYISFFYGRVEWRGFGERIGTTWIDGKGCWSIVVTFPFSFFVSFRTRTERNKVLFNPVGSKVGQEGL